MTSKNKPQFLFSLFSVVAMFISGYCYGPVFPENVNGTTISVEGPLFMSDYHSASALFRNASAELQAGTGFLHIALIQPKTFVFTYKGRSAERAVKKEVDSFERCLNRLQIADLAKGIESNKRLIVHLGQVVDERLVRFTFRGESVEFEAGEFGVLLGQFLKAHKIDINQVDLLAGSASTVGERLFKGMRAAGMQDFTVRCFKGSGVYVPLEGFVEPIEIIGVGDNNEEVSINTERFLRAGEVVPTEPTQESLLEVFTKGNPPEIVPPPENPPGCNP